MCVCVCVCVGGGGGCICVCVWGVCVYVYVCGVCVHKDEVDGNYVSHAALMPGGMMMMMAQGGGGGGWGGGGGGANSAPFPATPSKPGLLDTRYLWNNVVRSDTGREVIIFLLYVTVVRQMLGIEIRYYGKWLRNFIKTNIFKLSR